MSASSLTNPELSNQFHREQKAAPVRTVALYYPSQFTEGTEAFRLGRQVARAYFQDVIVPGRTNPPMREELSGMDLLGLNDAYEHAGLTLSGGPGSFGEHVLELACAAPHISHREQDSLIALVAAATPDTQQRAHQLLFRTLLPTSFQAASFTLRKWQNHPLLDRKELINEGALTVWSSIGVYAGKPAEQQVSLINYVRTAVEQKIHYLAITVSDANGGSIKDIHVPVARFNQTRRALTEEMGRTPSLSDIATTMGIPVADAYICQTILHPPLELDALDPAAPNREWQRWVSTVRQYDRVVPEDSNNIAGALRVEQLLEFLPPQWARVIELRFGLGGGAQQGNADIAASLGLLVTSESTIFHRAIDRLRYIALDIDSGTVDYDKLRKQGVRNVFGIFAAAHTETPVKPVAELKKDAEVLLRQVIEKPRDVDVIADLYGLRAHRSMPAAVEVASKHNISATLVRRIEHETLRALDATQPRLPDQIVFAGLQTLLNMSYELAPAGAKPLASVRPERIDINSVLHLLDGGESEASQPPSVDVETPEPAPSALFQAPETNLQSLPTYTSIEAIAALAGISVKQAKRVIAGLGHNSRFANTPPPRKLPLPDGRIVYHFRPNQVAMILDAVNTAALAEERLAEPDIS